ncbi:hypothetical protein CSPHI_04695 [Corynebacterium sphenisci DSM 44792]|uniref:Inner membrane protein YgaP-like transmembrane domain-containing protein n=1 Tax=Corynebacterium sphenisci DSM 44792 TaxID=1437874 RepID=A0A1L7CX60_9CORY|nr:DUF2892 domain-containing protein [Corynebacterium sphenisci]APT90459.1 hypothetical protein CSPHI_04695 [Corynebacterium sphenisci DSM 44792]
MKRNESTADRAVRAIAGIILLILAFTIAGAPWNWVLGIVGAVLLITGAVGFCPLYRLLGFSTCPAPAAPRVD